MGIRTSKNSKGHALSHRSPVRSLLKSEIQSALTWLSRRKDFSTGKRIGKTIQIDEIVKYDIDTFSLYGSTQEGKSVSINDIRGKAVFLKLLPGNKMHTADHFLFCLGGGNYIHVDWMTVYKAISQLYKDHGTVIYTDCWRLNKVKFLTLLKIAASGKM